MSVNGGGQAPSASPAPPATGRRRAGRNLAAAAAVGLLLAAALVAALFVVKAAFVVCVMAIVALGTHELAAALRPPGVTLPLPPLYAGAVAIPGAAYLWSVTGLAAALALTLLGVAFWRLRGPRDGFVRDVTAGGFAAWYLAFLAGFAVLLLRADDGPQRVLVFVATAVASDVGGYAAGVLLGRHPMAPRISPGKSWEGLAGSVLVCLGVGVAGVRLLLDGAWWVGLVFGAAAVTTAALGDLTESMIKRDLRIKDMGTVLPGHGGVLDRLDSLLPTAMIAWLVLGLLLPPGAPAVLW